MLATKRETFHHIWKSHLQACQWWEKRVDINWQDWQDKGFCRQQSAGSSLSTRQVAAFKQEAGHFSGKYLGGLNQKYNHLIFFLKNSWLLEKAVTCLVERLLPADCCLQNHLSCQFVCISIYNIYQENWMTVARNNKNNKQKYDMGR